MSTRHNCMIRDNGEGLVLIEFDCTACGARAGVQATNEQSWAWQRGKPAIKAFPKMRTRQLAMLIYQQCESCIADSDDEEAIAQDKDKEKASAK